VLVCMVWHVETTNPFHQPPAKQWTALECCGNILH
jgi:hypothetical protein